jgi:ribosomal protein S2
VDVVIPANDDSIRTIELILYELADAVADGKTKIPAVQDAAQRSRRVRSRRPVLARADEQARSTGAVEHTSAEDIVTSPAQQDNVDRPADPGGPDQL